MYTFNSPSLVEAADTAPFFHNHTVPDLESAVAFYGSDAFLQSPSSIGGPNGVVFVKISPDPNDPEVQDISAFLRVLDSLVAWIGSPRRSTPQYGRNMGIPFARGGW